MDYSDLQSSIHYNCGFLPNFRLQLLPRIMATAALNQLPLGYVFCPTDQELFQFYLHHKIVGNDTPYVLPVVDLYSEEPSVLWQNFGGIDDQYLHVFTQLKKKKSRVIRKVGSHGGTWSGESDAVKIFSSDDNHILLGTLKRFHYQNPKVGKSNENCSWIMHEYTINPDLVLNGNVHDRFVFCKIRQKILYHRREDQAPISTETIQVHEQAIANPGEETFKINKQFLGELMNPISTETIQVHEQAIANPEEETFQINEHFHGELMNLISTETIQVHEQAIANPEEETFQIDEQSLRELMNPISTESIKIHAQAEDSNEEQMFEINEQFFEELDDPLEDIDFSCMDDDLSLLDDLPLPW
ncbi:NAC domain-containing protein 96-like [Cucurbita pepo subsp. pepo]|uniref:NAC domain-containing protein 96-like n=1 Tax=Cucurbita pepo subsp. pepo TaxID=3664 RepID=UPI000C9D964E|nr:NAC domain-containing protein 96-like [Cucurbita pepo subsp. pepo]